VIKKKRSKRKGGVRDTSERGEEAYDYRKGDSVKEDTSSARPLAWYREVVMEKKKKPRGNLSLKFRELRERKPDDHLDRLLSTKNTRGRQRKKERGGYGERLSPRSEKDLERKGNRRAKRPSQKSTGPGEGGRVKRRKGRELQRNYL